MDKVIIDASNYLPLLELRLPQVLWTRIQVHLAECLPEEACGLISGIEGLVKQIYPITNIIHSPVRFKMDPIEQWQAFQDIEQSEGELMAIYHSHPTGPDHPSTTDITEAYYPDLVYIICYPQSRQWLCRGFYLRNRLPDEIPINILC